MEIFTIITTLFITIFSPAGINRLPITKDTIQNRIVEQILQFPQEKVYVQTDKNNYLLGERIWFRVHLTDAVSHTPSKENSSVFVELISPLDSVVSRLRIKQVDGAFSGSIILPQEFIEGEYVLRAYNYNLRNLGDKYFFYQNIQVRRSSFHEYTKPLSDTGLLTSKKNYEVSFYPEGGNLLEGVKSRVAFKALYPDSSPVKFKTFLVDDAGTVLKNIKSVYHGMGYFDITAVAGRQYYFMCEDSEANVKKFALPRPEYNMHSLQTRIINGKLNVSVLHSFTDSSKYNLQLLMHTRGMVHYLGPWNNRDTVQTFDISQFPSGIMQILLLDENRKSLSERLVFCRNVDNAIVNFAIDTKKDASGSIVKSVVNLRDSNGTPLSGSFSVSVTNSVDTRSEKAENILSTILLTSDLDDIVKNSSSYLHENEAEALDLLMIINGWRRYNIPKVINGYYSKPVYFDPQGMQIRGTVISESDGTPYKGRKVSLFAWNANYSADTITDSTGRFVFSGFEFPDSLIFVAQTAPAIGDISLELEKEVFPVVSNRTLNLVAGNHAHSRFSPSNDANMDGANQELTGEVGRKTVQLEEIEILAKQIEKTNYSYYMPKSGIDVLNSEELEKYPGANLSEIIMRIPFVRIVEDSKTYNKKVLIERMKSTLTPGEVRYAKLIIDDLVLNDYDIDDIVNHADIEKIGVLKGAAASILGGDGTGGAIVITTKKGHSQKNTSMNHIKLIKPLGFHTPVEFPRVLSKDRNQYREESNDSSRTTYWNPNVKVSSSGKVDFTFYTKDTSSTVLIEGVTDNGLLIYHKSIIKTK